MSSTATRNRSAGAQAAQNRKRKSTRELQFTVIYDSQIEQIILNDDQDVQSLAKMVESCFKIPIHKQFIYGWPAEEPADRSVKFKDLLPVDEVDVLLYVAVEGIIEPSDVVRVPDVDGAVPGTSRDAALKTDSSGPPNVQIISEQPGCTWQLNVTDLKNDVTYNEIPFEGTQKVAEVKSSFAELTGIPVEFQDWNGWPDIKMRELNEKMLKDVGLDKPFHSLILMDIRDGFTGSLSECVGPPECASPLGSPERSITPVELILQREASDLDNDIGKIQLQQTKHEEIIPKTEPSTSRPPTARKSTTKGAVIAHFKRLNVQRQRIGGNILEENQNEQGGQVETDILSQISLDVRKHSTAGPSTPKRCRSNEAGQKHLKSPNKQRDASLFLSFPEKVTKLLCGFFDPLTVLSLRRVCKATKKWISADGHVNLTSSEEEKWKSFSFSITGQDHKTFETVVNMNLPVTRFKFVIQDAEFYSGHDIESFITYCSLRVKDVTLTKFFLFQNLSERKLFESFINIEKLKIDELVNFEFSTSFPCPSTLASLQVLKLNYEISIPQQNMLIRPKSWDMTWGMLADCHNLFYFRFPRVNESRMEAGLGNDYGIFAPLLDYISLRVNSCGVSLEYLDLKHFNNPDSFYINRFVHLMRKCYAKDIKLKNIHSLVVQQVFDEDNVLSDEKYKFCENIISLVNYSPFIPNAPLRNVEKMTIDVIPSVTDYETLGKRYKEIFWPKLRVVKIKDSIQQNKDALLWKCWQEVQEDLYGHNDNEIFDRKSVQCIKIDSPKLPYFLSEGRLAQKFYNLKKLEITSWCKNDRILNKRLHAIWKKLRLEELRIENCPQLNDGSFIGEEDDDDYCSSSPAFLKLTQTLKKVTFGLDRTNVTDRSLIKVFSRMHFKIFIILSNKPTKITEPGILKLGHGEFGKHIEYFPFHCWSSASIEPGRFQRLAKSFRSMR